MDSSTETVDYLLENPTQEYRVLDDGFVRLVDMMPRRVPVGRTPDFAIIRNARVSLGHGLKKPHEDARLLRYLFTNRHSTPFESVIVTFHLRLPRFVATHFHRHRTASINEFSQRYAQVNEDAYFHPSRVDGSLRVQGTMSKQGSEGVSPDPEVAEINRRMEDRVDAMFDDYAELIRRGVGKEVARSHLPVSTYTEMYYTMNVWNLLHFISLRYDAHTQKETRVYAEAMYKLLQAVVPMTMDLFEELDRQSIKLSSSEIEAIANRTPLVGSAMETQAFEAKLARLGLALP